MNRKQKIIGSIIIIVMFLIFLVVGFIISSPKSHSQDTIFVDAPSKGNISQDSSNIWVQIGGEVKKPGVYSLPKGSRVKDLVDMAGGLKENAEELILVKKLLDGDYIFVRTKGMEITTASGSNIVEGKDKGKLDINRATIEEFDALPGIGPEKAKAIVQYREKNGSFKSIEDLTKVSGIGNATLEKFKDKIEAR